MTLHLHLVSFICLNIADNAASFPPFFLHSLTLSLLLFFSLSLLFLFSLLFPSLSLLLSFLLFLFLLALPFPPSPSGYISLWTRLGSDISLDYPDYYSFPGTVPKTRFTKYRPIIVCVGGEWYTFASHFFLPDNAHLAYIRGNFHGQLPQHFSRIDGISAPTAQPFNDKNEEEESRYVKLSTCDYLVASIDLTSSKESVIVEKRSTGSGPGSGLWMDRVRQFIQTLTAGDDDTGDEEEMSMDFSSPGNDSETVNFRYLFSRRVIDPSRSLSSLARAYFIPGLSRIKNTYNSYSAFKKN